ncbi:MAG: efflux RND transporter permease subunit, partial [Planctomycetota bacterium]
SDISLNMITMFSLIMALGIIVDDAIVIGENIFAHYSRGKDPTRAAIDGTKEVALGVIASMVTTVAIFMPLLQMEGEVGKIMRWMPVGVITALSVSLLEAFLILPHHLRHALGKIPRKAVGLRAAIDGLVRRFTERVYGPVLRWSVRRPLVPLAAMIAAFLISLGMLQSGRLKFQLFPELDGDFLFAQVELQQGADLRRTEALVRKIEGALLEVNEHFRPQQPEGRNLIEHVSTSFGFARTMANTPQNLDSGSHLAQVIVELLDADTRDARCDEVLRVWREKVGPVADVVRLTFEQMQVTPGGKPIDIQLRGEKLEDLNAASRRLREKIGTYPGIRNLSDDLRPGKEEVHVRLKPAGRLLGVTTAALASQLRGAFWGDIAEEFQRGPDAFEVHVRFTASDRRSLADLDDFEVRTPTGDTRPLGEVAWYEKVRGFSQIIRVDRQRTVSVTADLDTSRGNAAEILDDLETNHFPELLGEHPGVSINQEGQRKESAKTNTSLARGFVIGLVMIFLLLSFVFKSYVEPLIVMMAIPFGLIGAVVGHLVHGLDWTMPSSIGFVSLAGIVVNDSIVLVAFIKLRLKEGKGLVEAVQMAGIQRFRPVVLTSATTVAGLLPMMAETSLQAQFLVPMAVSISWGLLFATVLVLILVPSLYAILARLGWSQQIEVTHPGVGETA